MVRAHRRCREHEGEEVMQPRYDPLDPFGLRRFGDLGLRVIEAPEHARYTLPEGDSGVPWPPGFRDEINRWSRSSTRQ